jgi:hypothetical protein
LKKVLPRVPYAPDFRAFEKAGRSLADLHLNYENIEPWPLDEEAKPKGDLNDFAYYRVEKMRFASAGGRTKDRSVIVFNSRISLKSIPLEAYDYVINGKSAVEWVMEQYQDDVNKESGLRNDANDWCKEHEDPKYILNLVKRVIRVSLETIDITRQLPSLTAPAASAVAGDGAYVKIVPDSESLPVLKEFPEWAIQQRRSSVFRVSVPLTASVSNEELILRLAESPPPQIRLRKAGLIGSLSTEGSYSALARFPSGEIRTVGNIVIDADGSVNLSPFGMWSLIDPGLQTVPDGDINNIALCFDIIAIEVH